MRKLAVLLGSSVATIHGSWKIENQVKKTHPGVSVVESPPRATFHHSVPHTSENTKIYTTLSCQTFGGKLRVLEVEHSVVALTLSPLAAVVRFSSEASGGTWGFARGSVFDVTRGYHRDTLHARRMDAWGYQVLPKRRRGSWPVGSICHNTAPENTSSTHTAPAAAGSSTKASSL